MRWGGGGDRGCLMRLSLGCGTFIHILPSASGGAVSSPIGSMSQGRFPDAFCPIPCLGFQLGCRVKEFPFFPRHQRGFGNAESGPPRRVKDAVGSTLLEQSGSLLLSPKALATPGPSPTSHGCSGALRSGLREAPRPGQEALRSVPRSRGSAAPAGPHSPARPGAPAAASVRRFHLEGAVRNCTRGAGPRRPRHGSARHGSAPGP